MRRTAWILLAAVITAGLLGRLLTFAGQENVAVMGNSETIDLPIVMYHSVTVEGKSPGQYVITPSMLEKDLQYIKERGFTTVTVSQVKDYAENGTPLPEKPVMLTFDDGYYNNYANAYPLLLKYGMKAVLSPVGTLVEQFSATDDPPNEVWSYCTDSQLCEMAASGLVEIQNHSYDFHELKPRRGCLPKKSESDEEYRSVFMEDTRRAQELFRSLGIDEPCCYTYPYGALNERTEALTEECGLAVSLGCEEGINHLSQDGACLRRMKRWNRDGRMSTEQFWNQVLSRMGGESK